MQAAPPPPPAEESPEPYQYGASIPGPYPSGGPAPPLPEREPGLPPDSRAIFTDRRVPVGYNFGPPGGGYRGDPYQSPAYQPYPPVDPSIQTQEEQGNFAVEGVPSYGRQQDLRDRLRSRIGL